MKAPRTLAVLGPSGILPDDLLLYNGGSITIEGSGPPTNRRWLRSFFAWIRGGPKFNKYEALPAPS